METPKKRATTAPHVAPPFLAMLLATDPQAEITGRDKALLKEIAALEEDEADQVIGQTKSKPARVERSGCKPRGGLSSCRR